MKAAATALCIAGLCALPALAQEGRFLAPTDFQTHFEAHQGAAPTSGSRDGWESFPLSQEAGYDPSIQPETRSGVSYLARELAPTQDGFFQLGFVRRVNLAADGEASIRFRLRAPYLSTATTAVTIHIFRGPADEQHKLELTGSNWQQFTTRLNASSIPATAVAVVVDFAHAVHTRPERVLLTDLHIEALATKHTPILEPASLWDGTRELYYLSRSVALGQELKIATQSTSARWKLTSPDGSEVARGNGSKFHYRIPLAAQPGVWSVHVETSESESNALLLVRAETTIGIVFDKPPTITQPLIESIRERKAQLEKITAPNAGRNIALMNADWLLPGLPSYFAELLQPSELALMDAMLFRATGDQAARTQAEMLLSNMASWPIWVHPWFPAHGYHSYYPVGLMTKYIVMAKEFLGSDLSAHARSQLDQSLASLAIKPIYEEYVAEDRLQFNTSNWIGNTVGGALLAALSSNDPELGGYALGLFVKERDHINAAYTSDGSYGEGITYHRFDLETTELAAAASKRLLGVNLDKPLLNGERYMRYAAYDKDHLVDYGDSHVDLRPSNVFAYVAAQNQSPLTTDFYLRYRDEGTTQILPRVLWESQIKPAPVTDRGPTAAIFPERGVALLRDSWQEDSTVVAMRVGKNFNHNHADQGSLFYASGGTLWLGEAGYADYYKDPYYPTYNIQAIGHNVLLVDGNPESQVLPGNDVLGTYPQLTESHPSADVTIFRADLTTAYSSLSRYIRSVVHVSNGPTIVVDQIDATAPHTFTTVWHPAQAEALYDAGTCRLSLKAGNFSFGINSFSSSPLTSRLRTSPLPLESYALSEKGSISAPVQLEISTKNEVTSVLLVTLLTPPSVSTDTVAATWQESGSAHLLNFAKWTLRVDRRGQADAEISVSQR